MSDLTDAIQQVKDALLVGDSATQAIADAAEDYKLVPAALLRRFEVANNGQSPEVWLAGHLSRQVASEKLAELSRQRAVEKAKILATGKWKLRGHLADLAGRVFAIGKHEYAYVVFGSDDPQSAIRCVSLETQRIQTFPASRMPEIAKQIAPQMSLAL